MNNKTRRDIKAANKDNRTEKRKTGDIGEEAACKFLMKRGYEIVDRNYLKKYGEIDIVAKLGEKYYFVEVKTVTCERFPDVTQETNEHRPEENVHNNKLNRLRRVIQAYIAEKQLEDREWSFHVACVYLNTVLRLARVHVLEDIVL